MRTQSNKLDFRGQNIYVGIDVHSKSWSVTVLSESSVPKKFRQDPQPEALHKFLVTNYPGATYHSVYEAGFSGFWTHNRLTELGINNIVVNPADVPTMLKEKLRKTDAVDCGKLARGLRTGDLRGIYIPRAEILEIRSLIRLRNSIVKDTTREKNRIKSLLHFHGIEIPEQFTEYSIARFRSADQLAAYVGLIPMCHSSGEKEGIGDIAIRKHAILRCYFIEAAWIAIRKDPTMTVAYEAYRGRMNYNKAIVKIARRLVNRVFFVLKRQQEYVLCVV